METPKHFEWNEHCSKQEITLEPTNLSDAIGQAICRYCYNKGTWNCAFCEETLDEFTNTIVETYL